MNELSNLFLSCCLLLTSLVTAETLPPLKNGAAPQNFEELWADFDPRKEPLDVEVLKEWEEEGVILKVLRYRVGIFKGKKSMVAGIYGYPKDGAKLPGLVQIHGGGQYAHHNAVLTNAKRGYVTISISWAGRISAPDYRVGPNEVKLYWDKEISNSNYKVTTDWGALDGYHAPHKYPKNSFPSIPKPAHWTLDDVPSPRNNGWFLCTMAARRALTFLERQEQVNADKLGVYGHSMGGKLTVLTTGSDKRVKASAPSCGGISDRYNKDPLFAKTLGDNEYLKRITCPIIFLSPSNDFHGRINDLQIAVEEIQSKDWRVTCSPHHNHQDTSQYEVATQLWFDQHLKGEGTLPKTPSSQLNLNTADGIPEFSIKPDTSKEILSVDIYYTQQGQIDGLKDERDNTKNRYWHHVKATNKNGTWTAKAPILDKNKALWVYANISYPLTKSIQGAGYYYRTYTAESFTLSSKMAMIMPKQLKAAEIKETLKPSSLIEDFKADWSHKWFTYRPEHWPIKTHKLYDPIFHAPTNAKLSLDVHAKQVGKFVVGIDSHVAEVKIVEASKWQTIILSAADFKDVNRSQLSSWRNILELRLGDTETLRDRKKNLKKTFGAKWIGEGPKFRNLRWIENK
ncbi:MAG: dienelactone hydrolase family protein [Lentisphaeraceae bacterium]|nr:dienelactone hydrolase family protein [Lentisphaeraceae bacterium]